MNIKIKKRNGQVIFEGDFESIKQCVEAAVKGGVKYIEAGFGIKATFDDLRRTGAISLETKGEDKNMDSLVNAAYNQILGMMFEKMDTKPEPMELMKKNEDRYKQLSEDAKKVADAKSKVAPPAADPKAGGTKPTTGSGPFSQISTS